MKKKDRIEELTRNINNCTKLIRNPIIPEVTKKGLRDQQETYRKELKKVMKSKSK